MQKTLVESIGIGRWLIAAIALAGLVMWAAAFDGVAQADTTGPTVVRVERLNLPPSNSSFVTKEHIEVGVVFNEKITVQGNPKLPITIGALAYDAHFIQIYNNETAIRFFLNVTSAMEDKDGYSIAEDSLELDGSEIQDKAGNAATLDHDAVADNVRFRVNFNGPSLSHVNPISYAGPDGIYHAGDKIRLEAYFTEDVTITGKQHPDERRS